MNYTIRKIKQSEIYVLSDFCMKQYSFLKEPYRRQGKLPISQSFKFTYLTLESETVIFVLLQK